MGNNVSATMCPRLPGPLRGIFHKDLIMSAWQKMVLTSFSVFNVFS